MSTFTTMIAGVLIWEFVKAAVYVTRYVMQLPRRRRRVEVMSGWCATRVSHIQQGGMK